MSKAKKKEKTPKTPKQAAEAAAPKKTEVKITAAKGRPMLTWVGKRPLSRVTAFPAQHVETFNPPSYLEGEASSHTPSPLRGEGGGEGGLWKDWPTAYPKGGLLFHGDNKEVLAHLLANGFRGKVNLICLDSVIYEYGVIRKNAWKTWKSRVVLLFLRKAVCQGKKDI